MPAPAGAEAPLVISKHSSNNHNHNHTLPITTTTTTTMTTTTSSSPNTNKSTAILNRGTSISMARRAAATAKKLREQARQQLESQGIVTDMEVALDNLASRSASTRANVSQNKSKRLKRVKWSQDEVIALKKGVEKHGEGRWAVILREYATSFNPVRISVDLKDKWRNLFKAQKPCLKDNRQIIQQEQQHSPQLQSQSQSQHHQSQQQQQHSPSSDHYNLHPGSLPRLRPLNGSSPQKSQAKNHMFTMNPIDQQVSSIIHQSNQTSLVNNNHIHHQILSQQPSQLQSQSHSHSHSQSQSQQTQNQQNHLKSDNIHQQQQQQQTHTFIHHSYESRYDTIHHQQSIEHSIKPENNTIQTLLQQQERINQLDQHTNVDHLQNDTTQLVTQMTHHPSSQSNQQSHTNFQSHHSSSTPFHQAHHPINTPESNVEHPAPGLTEMETQAMFTPATSQVILDDGIDQHTHKNSNTQSHLDERENTDPNHPSTSLSNDHSQLLSIRQSDQQHDQNQIIHPSSSNSDHHHHHHHHNINLGRIGQYNIEPKSVQDIADHQQVQSHQINMEPNRSTSMSNSVHTITDNVTNTTSLCNISQQRHLENEKPIDDTNNDVDTTPVISSTESRPITVNETIKVTTSNPMSSQHLYNETGDINERKLSLDQLGMVTENRRDTLNMMYTDKKENNSSKHLDDETQTPNGMVNDFMEQRPITTVVDGITTSCQVEMMGVDEMNKLRVPIMEHVGNNGPYSRNRKRNFEIMDRMDDCATMEQATRSDADLDGKKARA